MSEAQEWGMRARDSLDEGWATGLATICPIHLRPLRTRWNDIEPCACLPEDFECDQVGLHALDEVRWMFQDTDARGNLAD